MKIIGINFGIHIPIHGLYDYSAARKITVEADKLGYHSIWLGDHFYLPSEAYKNMGGDSDKPDKLDAWTTLAALAAQTERIKLGPRVSPLPFYLPARLAKMIATVDVISNGRVMFGIGAGWNKEEAISYDVGWDEHEVRISKMNEALEIILKMWKEDRANYEGKYYEIDDAPLWPKPIQKPYPPLWFGGSSDLVIEATAKYGGGLLPLTDISTEEFEKLSDKLEEVSINSSRGGEIVVAPSLSFPEGLGEEPSDWTKNIGEFKELGIKLMLLDLTKANIPPEDSLRFLKQFSDEMIDM